MVVRQVKTYSNESIHRIQSINREISKLVNKPVGNDQQVLIIPADPIHGVFELFDESKAAPLKFEKQTSDLLKPVVDYR